jgi:predicted transcriptional regulator
MAARGRPPAGRDGSKTSEYRVLSVRVPEDTHRLLAELAAVMSLTRGRVVETALPALGVSLSREQRRTLEAMSLVKKGARVSNRRR